MGLLEDGTYEMYLKESEFKFKELKKEDIAFGKEIRINNTDYFIIKDLGNGKFEAVSKQYLKSLIFQKYGHNYREGESLESYRKAWEGTIDAIDVFEIPKTAFQPYIEITPELKRLIKGEPPLLKQPSGKPVYMPKEIPQYGMIEKVRAFEMPEMVSLARSLMGKYPEIRKSLGKASGRVQLSVDIEGRKIDMFLKADQFVVGNEEELAKVMAHEIGHLIDALPDKNLARGNLLGRLYTLNKFLKSTFNKKTGKSIDRTKLRREALSEILSEENIKHKEYRADKSIRERLKPYIDIRLREKIDARGIIRNEVIRKELLALTEIWHPYDKSEVPPHYIQYRESPAELYAEAISVLLNSPEILEKEAPTFYKEFFNALDKKPQVKADYFEFMELLSGSTEKIFEARKKDILEGFERAEELQRILKERRMLARENLGDNIRRQLDDINHPINKRQNRLEAEGKVFSEEDNPRFRLQEMTLIDNENFVLLCDLNNGVAKILDRFNIAEHDFGVYLTLERIIKGRKDIANPYGLSPKNATEQLNYLRDSIGEDKFYIMRDVATFLHNEIFKIVENGVRDGSISQEVFENTIKPNKDNYVAFRVIDYMQENMPAHIQAQVGTLKQIENPFLSTVLKAIAMNRLNGVQRAKNAVIKMLKEDYSNEIAETKAIKRKGVTKFIPAKGKGTIEVLENGKMMSYDVDPYIAEVFNKGKVGDINMLMGLIGTLNSKIFKPLVTTYNLNFALVTNPQRDFKRTWKLLPRLKRLFDDERLFFELARTYVKHLEDIKTHARGKMTELTREMIETKAIEAPMYQYNYDAPEGRFGEVLEKFGVVKKYDPQNATTVEKVKRFLLTPIRKVLEGIRFISSTTEYASKIAGYSQRKQRGEVKGGTLAHNTRNYTGTPFYKTKGKFTEVTNQVFIFSNILKEDVKTQIEIGTNPTTRSGYWIKTVKMDILPKLLMFLAASGALGKKLKDFFEDVPEYDKTNYIIVPLGIDETGKAVYMRLSHDEAGRFFAGTYWKIANAIKDGGDIKELQEILDFGEEQLPNLTPMIKLPIDWLQYLTGHNPYDPFRGRYIIDETTYSAGGKYAFKRMAMWTTNSLGLTKFATYDRSKNTTTQTFMQIAPVFSTLIKITDYGKQEKLREEAEKVKKEESRQILEDRKIIEKYVKLAREENTTLFAATKYKNDLIMERLGDKPKTREDIKRVNQLMTRFKRALKRGLHDDPVIASLLNATSNDQRIAILRKVATEMSEKDFNKFIQELLEDNIISKELLYNLTHKK